MAAVGGLHSLRSPSPSNEQFSTDAPHPICRCFKVNFCQQYGLKILMLQPHFAKAGGTVGAVLEKAIAERNAVINAEQYLSGAAAYSAARLKDHLNYVSAIVTLAPLMGLLGTVTGMIRSFDILSISEGQPFAITGGVAEALVATGFGLLVAIIAMLVYVWLSQRANRIIEDLEAAGSAYLACLSEK